MKAIFKGDNFAIVWNIIDSSTHTPFDFSGMKVEVGLYSECCKKAIQTYNISNGTIEFEVESEELQNGVYNLMCRYNTENEQAYCIYKRAFQITGKPEFASNVETIILESKASHIDATDHDDPIPDFENCQLIAQELFKENFRLPQLTADRAIADEHGNRIADTYVSREAVTKHIRNTYNQQFLENPPLITEGYITPQMLSDETRQLLEESGATINNLPDGEDLQSVHGVLKLSNKQHNPNSYSGLGRQYLRKNIVAGQNILTQSMLQWPNTIYIIQYDYDLNEAEITIPEGCVLDFQGGSFSNGTIIGNNTNINNGLNFIFNKISLKGKWCINNLIPQWFGSKGNGINDDSESLKETIIQAIKIKSNVLIPDGKYKVKVSISLKEIFEESYTYEKGDAGIRIHGESANTILYSEDGTILSLYGINTNQRNGYLRYITIDTLRFFGNNNKVLALYMYFCQHINISNVQIEDCRGGAFHFCASMDMNIDSIDAIGIGNIYSDDDVRYGMVFDEGYYINPEQAPSRCNAIKIVNSRFESYPALINSNSSAFDIQFSNCKFEGTAKNTTKYRPIRIINGTNFTFNNCLFTIAKYEEESNPRDNGLYYCEIKSSAIHNTSIRKTNFNSCVFQTGGGLIRWMDIDETSIIDCSFGGAFGSIINETDTDDMMDSPIKLGHNNLIKDSYIYVNGSRVLDIVGSYNNVNFNIITSSNTWYPLAHIRFTDANALYNNVSIKRENGSDTNGHLVYAKPFTDENGFVNLGNNKVNFENTNNITFLTTESSINNNKFPKIIKLDGAGTIRNLRYCYDGYSVTIISANNNIISTETNSNIKLYNNRIKTYIQAGEVLNIKFICGVGYITNKTNDSNKGVDFNSRPELGYNSTGFITLDSNLQKIIFYKHNKWYDAFGNNPDVVTSGLKNQRPTNITPGFVYIDKSLSPPRPIYAVSIKDSLTGEMNWVDATGTEV